MDFLSDVLDKEELIIYTLRKLYKDSGYKKDRMSKFEEYDLYVKNKDFLLSDNIITFTDIDGKLMALKPDVTLSIIKNTKDDDDTLSKLYYNENVYRASSNSESYKEIMQVGVECIGKIDNLCICESILLAVKSLSKIKNDFILDISHLDIIDKITKELNISETGKKHIIKAFGEKNTQYMDEILSEENLPKKSGEFIKSLIHTYGIPKDVILKLEESEFSSVIKDEIDLLKSISDTLIKNGFEKNARIDFSLFSSTSVLSSSQSAIALARISLE